MASLGAVGIALLATGTVCLTSGCSTVGYYAHSVTGHLAIVRAAKPVPEWLADSGTGAGLRARLELSQRIRDFAVSELREPDNASYRRYADLKRAAAVWKMGASLLAPGGMLVGAWLTEAIGIRGALWGLFVGVLFAAAPLASPAASGATVGYVYVLMRPPDSGFRQALMSSYANRSALLVAAGGALASALLVFAVLLLITRPLKRLTDAADAVSNTATTRVGTTVPATMLGNDGYATRNDEIGRLARAFGAMVSRLHEQVQRVKRMDDTRREWLANVSHDLRTPLTSLIGHLETVQLRGDRLSQAERDRFLDVALRNAQHLDRLSSSLFDLARLDSDDLPLDKSPSHLGELLDDLIARFVPAAEANQIALTVDYGEALPLVTVDAALVERAVVNLIDNALRYTPAGGCIMLSARAERGGVALTVADTGSGIDPAHLASVFERFFQGSEHREGRGHAGLGLAVVQRVAELHSGSAQAANQASGGAVFTLWFPGGGGGMPALDS